MAVDEVACPRCDDPSGRRVRKDGWASTKDGWRQVYRCLSPDGASHRFYGPLAGDPVPDARRGSHNLRCPQPGHAGSVIQSRGLRAARDGTWRRYTCVRPGGQKHSFRVMVGAEGAPVAAVVPPPPDCPEHDDARVVRAGTYPSGGSRRQRYQCHPADGSKPHQFTPPLSREAVAPGDACVRCDELLSPHHGPITAARHTPWTLTGVTKALNDLSLGESYANVSLALRAQRDAAREHLSEAHGVEAFGSLAAPVASSSTSYSREDKKNAWRVAADLVEQYAPPLFAEAEARLRVTTEAQRVANDAILAADPSATLQAPVVYLLDDLPIWTRSNGVKRPAWNVLTVAEIRWKESDDPFLLPQRDSRLRLARAFPRTNSDAWKLVLDELAVRPDFVVADYGTGLQNAVRDYYGPGVGVIPSLWHIHRNLRDALITLPNTTFNEGKEKVLIDPLRKHLSMLARDELIGRTEQDIAHWWDGFEAIVKALPAPLAKIRRQRAVHEPRLVAALPLLDANPHLPASNAAVENRIRNALKPFLENRSHLFGNQERTNRLLNLLVCREAGTFTDLDALALRIRALNEANGGWAPAPRQILDRQPPASVAQGKPFQSLKSHTVVARLAKDRGITTRAQTRAAAPRLVVQNKSPERLASLEIRQWARDLGLPVAKTGDLKAGISEAYEAHQKGASAEEARKIFEDAQAELRAKDAADKRAKRAAGRYGRGREEELRPIREWADKNGYHVPRRATIPKNVMDAYEAAQKGKTLKRRPSKQPRKKQP